MNETSGLLLKVTLRMGVVAILFLGGVWFGAHLIARKYTRRVAEDVAFMKGLVTP